MARIRQAKKKKLTYHERSQLVAKERKLRPFLRRLVLTAKFSTFFAIILGGWWLYHSGLIANTATTLQEETLTFSAKAGLNLQTIQIEGLARLSSEDILAALPEATAHQPESYPIYGFSLEEIQHSVEQLGWVERAYIRRELPDSLHITIHERHPAAIWQHQEQLALIDKNGTIISYQDVPAFSNLPVIVGEDARAHINSLFALLEQEPQLMPRVTAAIRVGKRRWNLRLDNGIEIKLPEEDSAAAWQQLAQLHYADHLLDRSLQYIDLRIKDKLYLKPTDDVDLDAEDDSKSKRRRY